VLVSKEAERCESIAALVWGASKHELDDFHENSAPDLFSALHDSIEAGLT
jgi:hypothetical protein